MNAAGEPRSPGVVLVASVADAVAALADLGPAAACLAGGTWIMRAGCRGQRPPGQLVALHRIRELRAQADPRPGRAGAEVVLGALCTHTELAALDAPPALHGLVTAAATGAFPQVRNVASIGGNICAAGFAEADLVPALLALDARVETATPHGRRVVPVTDLAGLGTAPGEVLTTVLVPAPPARRSGFARLTVRGGGEYAIANVCVRVDLAGGVVTAAAVAVGSVEARARLVPAAAAALVGRPLDDASVAEAGRLAAAECEPRVGLDAPAWYRRAVLPAMVRRACADLVTRPIDRE